MLSARFTVIDMSFLLQRGPLTRSESGWLFPGHHATTASVVVSCQAGGYNQWDMGTNKHMLGDLKITNWTFYSFMVTIVKPAYHPLSIPSFLFMKAPDSEF